MLHNGGKRKKEEGSEGKKKKKKKREKIGDVTFYRPNQSPSSLTMRHLVALSDQC